MTSLRDPQAARVFIVGANQAKQYPVEAISHTRHMDALFNRDGESCRGLYDELYPKPSRSRPNIDGFTARLAAAGVTEVLETNVVCYSTGMAADLRKREHRLGAMVGGRIFQSLAQAIRPKIVVLHGKGTCDEFEKQFGIAVPRPYDEEGQGICKINLLFSGVETEFISIRSLAQPQYNAWAAWAPRHLDAVSKYIASCL